MKVAMHVTLHALEHSSVKKSILKTLMKTSWELSDIYSVKADSIIGQDGGVVSAILVYLLENNIVDAVSIVGEDKDAPWRPQSKLTSSVQDVITAAGTKYSTTPIGFKPLNNM